MKFLKKLIIFFVLTFIIFCSVVIIFKNYFIMPSSLKNHFISKRVIKNAPKNSESFILKTKERNIVVWKFNSENNNSDLLHNKKFALHFIGNAEILPSHYSKDSKISFLNSLGYTVYAINYRSVEQNSKKLTERGIKKDARNLMKYVSKKENVNPSDILISGYSIGTGTATYIANKYSSKILILLAPYTSFKDIVKKRTFFKYFINFVQIDFPSKNEIQGLKNTCVVIAHGKKDKVIPFSHSQRLKNLYKGNAKITLTLNDNADHVTILEKSKDKLQTLIKECEKLQF